MQNTAAYVNSIPLGDRDMAAPLSHTSEGERAINPELWHACAGPCISLPPIGGLVVYFPQGHIEQVAASTHKDIDGQFPNYQDLQPQLFCQLHNVTLHADVETDEVFAQMTLQPVNGRDKDKDLSPDLGIQNRQPTDFFCKILTASDTSTHGGFSVPRRAAEKIFRPLDFTKQPPSQELQAKDLHDHVWTFRHIYRGQPKRHLLTTGWSLFVGTKRLVAGDSVLFIRNEKGQLLLGIKRRVNMQHFMMPSSVLSSDSMHIGVLASAAHAAATSSCFQVFYSPRTSPSEFVIPLAKYRKAVHCNQVSMGMRFWMTFETEESTLRRYMGTVTGIGDLDSAHWPRSNWRNVEVGWDESSADDRPRRVSVWEIEPVSSPFLICPPYFMGPKRPQHLSLLGNEGDVEGRKRCFKWLPGENPSVFANVTGDVSWMQQPELIQPVFPDMNGRAPWMQMQRPEVILSDMYKTISASLASQEFKGTDTSNMLQHQAQLQFLLPQEEPMEQKQKYIWPQPSAYQQQVYESQVQHQSSSRHLQLQATTMLPVVQHPSASKPFPQPLAEPPLSRRRDHLTCERQQQSIIQLPVLQLKQSLQRPDASENMVHLSSDQLELSCTLPAHPNFPDAMKHYSTFSETVSASQSVVPSAKVECTLESPHLGTFGSVHNGHVPHLLQSNQSVQQQPPSEQPVLCTLPPLEEHIFQTRPHPTSQTRQSDSSSTFTPCLFSLPPSELIDNQSLLSSATGSFQSRDVTMSKELHGQTMDGNMDAATVSSQTMLDTSNMASGAINSTDETLLQWDYNWSQLPAPVRTYTKVHKSGSVGRSIDVSRIKNYDELRKELARMFNLDGQLENPQSSTWKLVFVDHEKDILLVGDDPWDEFVNCVRTIKILSTAQVLKMNQEDFPSQNSLQMHQQTTGSTSAGDCQYGKAPMISEEKRKKLFAKVGDTGASA